MLRAVTFRSAQCLRTVLRHKQPLIRFLHEKVRPSDELIPKVVKPPKTTADSTTIQGDISEDMLDKKEQKFETLSTDRIMQSTGEDCWNSFRGNYRNGTLSLKDVLLLFRGVYREAQYQKYREAPSAVYTISCCGIFPVASVGLFTLVAGGAMPGLAYLQLTYSASILSFLGGIAWGHVMTQENVSMERLGWAVVPPVLAWSATMLPLPFGFALASSGFVASMIHDILLTSYPQWFKSLRYILTVIALVSFAPTFFMTALTF